MLNRAGLIVAILFATASLDFAMAQDRPEQWAAAFKVDCSKELKSQCKGVAEGRGRLLACLYARDSKLSPKCATTVSESLVRLGEALGALANVRRVCEADARQFCAGVKLGDGNLIDCLAKSRKAVSATCNAVLDTAFLRP